MSYRPSPVIVHWRNPRAETGNIDTSWWAWRIVQGLGTPLTFADIEHLQDLILINRPRGGMQNREITALALALIRLLDTHRELDLTYTAVRPRRFKCP